MEILTRHVLESLSFRSVSEDMLINIDLLLLGDEAIPAIEKVASRRLGLVELVVAGLPDLWEQKARPYVAERKKERQDLGDFVWLLEKMVRDGVPYDPLRLLDLAAI